MGISEVCVRTNVGYTVTLKHAQHVLNLHFDLCSIHGMDQEG